MNKTVYEDGKYCMQDIGNLYIGSKYTFEEILEDEEIFFKFRLLVQRYLLPEADREDTLETHLYYLDDKSFLVKIYRQLKARVKISILEDRKHLNGKTVREYMTRTVPVEELVKMSVSQKEAAGVVIQELAVSKLALMTF